MFVSASDSVHMCVPALSVSLKVAAERAVDVRVRDLCVSVCVSVYVSV